MLDLLWQNLEWIAVFFGVVSVSLTVFQSIWCWPTGLVMVSLYVIIFYQSKLYSDMILHVFYIGMQFYGWYNWRYGNGLDQDLPVRRVQPRGTAIAIAVSLIGIVSWGWLMDTLTDASLAYFDATTTVLSIIAQIWMAKKILENWALWLAVDVLAIGIYLYKDLFATAGLYAVFLVLATAGWIQWARSMQSPHLTR